MKQDILTACVQTQQQRKSRKQTANNHNRYRDPKCSGGPPPHHLARETATHSGLTRRCVSFLGSQLNIHHHVARLPIQQPDGVH